jgi:hypothetical protein
MLRLPRDRMLRKKARSTSGIPNNFPLYATQSQLGHLPIHQRFCLGDQVGDGFALWNNGMYSRRS